MSEGYRHRYQALLVRSHVDGYSGHPQLQQKFVLLGDATLK